ncbi:hypothetical protein B0H11DRAFT_1910004 [Mycena galericulata]|nr:hypothetical protein B0H11DRAFT_1910004 [Mycena galericulata]
MALFTLGSFLCDVSNLGADQTQEERNSVSFVVDEELRRNGVHGLCKEVELFLQRLENGNMPARRDSATESRRLNKDPTRYSRPASTLHPTHCAKPSARTTITGIIDVGVGTASGRPASPTLHRRHPRHVQFGVGTLFA